jgi:hypothetical protein
MKKFFSFVTFFCFLTATLYIPMAQAKGKKVRVADSKSIQFIDESEVNEEGMLKSCPYPCVCVQYDFMDMEGNILKTFFKKDPKCIPIVGEQKMPRDPCDNGGCSTPIYKQGWFWAVITAGVIATVVGIVFLTMKSTTTTTVKQQGLQLKTQGLGFRF